MPTPTKGTRLGGSPSHERMMLANLATSLFEHGSITTTEAKARRLRPFAERLITKARRGDLHARRQVMKAVRDKTVVHELFTEIGPRFATRPGGYIRITKVSPRKGDNAPMAVIALVDEEYKPEEQAGKKSTAKKAAKTSTSKAAAAGPAAAAEPTEEESAEEAAVEEGTAEAVAEPTVATEEFVTEAEEPAGEAEESAEKSADAEDAADADEAADAEKAAGDGEGDEKS